MLHYSAGLAASTWRPNGQAGQTCSTAKSTRSAAVCWRTTFRMQFSMKTSRQQTLPFGEDESTSLQEAFRASRSASPENERARTMTVTSGRRCCEQFAKSVPAGSWARTFADLLIGRREWFSTRCSLTWKLSATKSNRLYFQLVPSTLHTAATECGLLPTVQTQGLKVCKNGKTWPMDVKLLPTPTARDYKGESINNSKFRRGLRATPGGTLPDVISTVGNASQLSPLFLAEMMGFPPDWTVLPFLDGEPTPSKPTETR